MRAGISEKEGEIMTLISIFLDSPQKYLSVRHLRDVMEAERQAEISYQKVVKLLGKLEEYDLLEAKSTLYRGDTRRTYRLRRPYDEIKTELTLEIAKNEE